MIGTNKIFRLNIILFLLFLFMIFSTYCKRTEKSEKVIPKETHIKHAEHKHSEDEKKAAKKTLYHCPMHPNYISDKPGECPICGMNLVPIEEEEHEKMEMIEGTVKITPEKQQLIGVTIGKVEYRNLEKVIRTVARVAYDETKLTYINTKFPGWVEKLYVDYTGKLVKKGQPLFSIYSPELVSAQEEYLLALKAKEYFESKIYDEVKSSTYELLDSAKRRLIYWDITEEQIKELEKSKKPLKTMKFYSPFTGFVINKNILQGKYVLPGENLYTIADISSIWILADIYEYELPFVSIGQTASIELLYFPGEQFAGKITHIYPYLENETRTVKVRIELPNRDFKLKPDMYGIVNLKVNLGTKLTIPESAMLDSGKRKLIFIDIGDGYFEPREVIIGLKIDDYYEVIDGVKEGERVVTSANFLIDSESKLKSAIKKLHEH